MGGLVLAPANAAAQFGASQNRFRLGLEPTGSRVGDSTCPGDALRVFLVTQLGPHHMLGL